MLLRTWANWTRRSSIRQSPPRAESPMQYVTTSWLICSSPKVWLLPGRYLDLHGRARFQGSKQLRESGPGSQLGHLVILHPSAKKALKYLGPPNPAFLGGNLWFEVPRLGEPNFEPLSLQSIATWICVASQNYMVSLRLVSVLDLDIAWLCKGTPILQV